MKPQQKILSRVVFDPMLEAVVLAKNQPQYLPLPVIRSSYPLGRVTSRWSLSLWERILVLFGGSLWIQQLTFGDPTQPIKPLLKEPTESQCL